MKPDGRAAEECTAIATDRMVQMLGADAGPFVLRLDLSRLEAYTSAARNLCIRRLTPFRKRITKLQARLGPAHPKEALLRMALRTAATVLGFKDLEYLDGGAS